MQYKYYKNLWRINKMIKVILLAVFFITAYELGKMAGMKLILELIKQYLEDSKDIDDFLYKFSLLWKNEMEDKWN